MLVCQWTKDLQLDNGPLCPGLVFIQLLKWQNGCQPELCNLCVGVLNVSVSAAAVQSHAACGNGVVNVPERGRVDTVTRGLLVKVCSLLLLGCTDSVWCNCL